MTGEGIMTGNNPFLGLYNQMFQGVKDVNPGVCNKKKLEKASKRPFQ